MSDVKADVRFEVALRDNFTCQYCGARPGHAEIEIDHLVPVSMRGSDNPENLVAACKKCNRTKGASILFPESMIEGIDSLDKEWRVHRSFGDWQVKFCAEQMVLELTPWEYWIPIERAFEPDWLAKDWDEEWKSDFLRAIAYFRSLLRPQAESKGLAAIEEGSSE